MHIPYFRNDAEAAAVGERERPYRTALASPNGDEYAVRYGDRAAMVAERCRVAAMKGDTKALQRECHALSLVLASERPGLFMDSRPRPKPASPGPARTSFFRRLERHSRARGEAAN